MATEVKLAARTRPDGEQGSRAARRLRRAGEVPATLYGHGSEPASVAVNARDLRAALHTDAGSNALLSLQLDGGEELALAREIVRHPIRDEYTHVDFVRVSRTERVSADVPVILVGEAVGVKEEGGIIQQARTSLSVEAMITAIPESIEIDISDLSSEAALTVGSVHVGEGVELLDDEDTVIASIVIPRGIEEEATDAAEGEDGEEGEGEESDADEGGDEGDE